MSIQNEARQARRSEETRAVGSQSTHLIESTVEDGQILQHRVGIDTWCSYAVGDARDAAAMAACRRDRDAVDMEEHGLSDAVATRIHHGFLAFRELAL